MTDLNILKAINHITLFLSGLPISPTNTAKSCPTITVTKAATPCTKIKLQPTTIITGIKSTKCNCDATHVKTVYKTVTEYHGQANKVKPTASVSGVHVQSTVMKNEIPRNGTGCGNDATYGQNGKKIIVTNVLPYCEITVFIFIEEFHKEGEGKGKVGFLEGGERGSCHHVSV